MIFPPLDRADITLQDIEQHEGDSTQRDMLGERTISTPCIAGPSDNSTDRSTATRYHLRRDPKKRKLFQMPSFKKKKR